MLMFRSAILTCIGCLLAASPTPAASQAACKPTVTGSTAAHSEVVDQRRRWTGVFAVDASRCATQAGAFDIEFLRLKENAPDESFIETFAWTPGRTEATLEIASDEWLADHRLGRVLPCRCAQ